jgi:HAMP domain-containing protein
LDVIDQQKKSKVHKILFATMHFVPEHSNIWSVVGEMNQKIRDLNLKNLKICPFNLHKSVMKTIPESGSHTLWAKGVMWSEYQLSLGLGRTHSEPALDKIKGFVESAMNNAFNNEHKPKSSEKVNQLEPPKLYKTPGYKSNAQCMAILAERGLVPARTQSEGTQPSSQPRAAVDRTRSLGDQPCRTKAAARSEDQGYRMVANQRQINRQSDNAAPIEAKDTEKEKNCNEMTNIAMLDQLQIQADEIGDLEAEVKRLRQERSELRMQKDKMEEKYKAENLEAEVKRLRQERNEARMEKEKIEEKYQARKDQAKQLKIKVEQKDRVAEQRDRELDDYCYENDNLKSKVQNLEEEVNRLEADYECLANLYSGTATRRSGRSGNKKRYVGRAEKDKKDRR